MNDAVGSDARNAGSSSPVVVMVYGTESPMCFSVSAQKRARSVFATLQSSVLRSAFSV